MPENLEGWMRGYFAKTPSLEVVHHLCLREKADLFWPFPHEPVTNINRRIAVASLDATDEEKEREGEREREEKQKEKT